MNTVETYSLHGLLVRSALPLHQRRAPAGAPADLDVTWAAPAPVPRERPPGEVIAELVSDGVYLYTVTADPSGYVLRFYATCEFRLTADLRFAECSCDPEADPALASVLLLGTVLAFVLIMSGRLVLHASAAERAGRAIGIVGASGMGKSTLTALLCSEGARLVTDDVLRLDDSGDAVRCALGTSEVRLRDRAADLADRFVRPPGHRITADDRLALDLTMAGPEPPVLAALVVPFPSRQARRVEAERVQGAEGVLSLARFPRLLGWREPASAGRQFEALAELVGRVPVWHVVVPWGPPFPRSVATDLWSLAS
jgi:hypothetical protein